MDSRITKIARSLSSVARASLFGVGGIDSSLNMLNVGNMKVDTMFLLCRENRENVLFYTDSSRSYELRFIAVFEDTDIKDDTFGEVRFSRTQQLPFKTPISTTNITILYFDEPMNSSVDTFDRMGHPDSDLSEAMLRSTLSLFMYFVKRSPNRYFSVEFKNGNDGHMSFQSDKGLWSGSADRLGARQYRIRFECNGLNFAGGRPSQEDVFQMVNNCFGRFSHVDDVSGTATLVGVFLEFTATLR